MLSTGLRFHDVANIFPLMSDAELLDLAEDIKAHGLREPIWVHEDESILDGRNRYLACELVDVEPAFRTWDGAGSLVSFVLSLNLHRRHLDTSQRALVAARVANLQRGDNQHTEISGTSQAEAGALLNVSSDSVGFAKRVLAEGAPELLQAVERGEVAVSSAAALTDLPVDDQAAIVALPEDERREAIKDVKEGRKPHVTHNSGNNEWYTPETLIKAVRQVLGSIDLDPASSEAANKVVKAKQFFTIEDDGLKLKWAGNVFLNPPYSKDLVAQFGNKLIDSLQAKTVSSAVVLVNNATETSWFYELAERANAVCFPTGRVKYWSPEKDSSAPLQGQAVLYIGSKIATFVAAFSVFGIVWVKP